MKRPWTRVVVCLLTAAFVCMVCAGCAFFTPERNRRRMHVIRTDYQHMLDDLDWILALDKPSRLYDDRRPQ